MRDEIFEERVKDPELKRILRNVKSLGKLLEFDITTRGRILVMFINIEDIIDKIIASYFCARDKQDQLIAIVVRGLSFSKKLEILHKILKYNYPIMHERSKKLLKQLRTFSELRNTLAHATRDHEYLADNVKENNIGEDRIALTTYEEGKKTTFALSKTEVKTKIAEIEAAYGWLLEMLTEVEMREKRC